MLHEIEYRDAEVARQVQTRLFKDTGTPPLPMMSNGDVPEAVGGKVYFMVLWLCLNDEIEAEFFFWYYFLVNNHVELDALRKTFSICLGNLDLI